MNLHAPTAPGAADGAETETDEEDAAARVDKREIGALAAGPHTASHFHLNLQRSKLSFTTVLRTSSSIRTCAPETLRWHQVAVISTWYLEGAGS